MKFRLTVSEVANAMSGSQSEAEIDAVGEDEAHSPSVHARPEPGTAFLDDNATVGEPESGGKVVSQRSIVPNATGRDPEAWALAQGWLVGPDAAENPSDSADISDQEPTSSDEEVMNSVEGESGDFVATARQDLTANSAAEDASLDPDASSDNRILHVSEVSAEQGFDPDAGDHSEVAIDAVEEGEANSPGEHAPPEPDTGLQDERVSADQPRTAGNAPAQPSIGPDATGKNPEVRSLGQGQRAGPVDASVPAGDFDCGVAPSAEEARDSAGVESGASAAPDIDRGLSSTLYIFPQVHVQKISVFAIASRASSSGSTRPPMSPTSFHRFCQDQ